VPLIRICRLLLCFLPCVASCVSTLATPSHRPELKVALSSKSVKDRLVQSWSAAGWMVTTSDDLGVSLEQPVDGNASVWIGPGSWVVRFNLSEVDSSTTQIRATCFLRKSAGGAQDVSSAKMGWTTQESLESIFAAERIDGPYTTQPR
jgi:hypothetical protein